ncbi:uncharacterized protein [Henckelia pumila]|uniref:uncharacterized protein n=1 Tax=Henckelia pumila TaxID=405737 RepID=UPI003C6E8D39
MKVCEERQVLARPRNSERGPRLPPSDKFCDFHQEYGHFTNDCQRLGESKTRKYSIVQIESLYCDYEISTRDPHSEEVQKIIYEDPRIRAELTRRANTPRQGRAPQWRNQRNEVRGNQPNHQRRAPPERRRLENFEVNPQLNHFTDPNISFGKEDFKDVTIPHNDPLLVTLTISNYDVARIFVDTGSSVNIIFKETLDQMKLEGFELDPINTTLYGFTGHALQPLGQIVLPLSLGSGEQRVTKMACFTVLDSPSSFNGILGRLALSDFRAVASTYHQKLKFPSGKEVGIVRGDQNSARMCYVNEVKVDAKRS